MLATPSSASGRVSPEELARGGQRVIEISAELVFAERRDKPGFEHHFHRLRLHTREQDLHAIAMQLLDCDPEGMQPTRVHRRHVAHPEDDDLRLAARTA